MIIDIREIPEEGFRLKGQTSEDIFQLNERNLRPSGPVEYDLQVDLVDESLLVRGDIRAPFQTECVRCLEPVNLRIELDDCLFYLPIEEESTIDLTETVREDILLALPVYPHCEDGTPAQACPHAGKFEGSEGGNRERAEPSNEDPGDQWSSLDDFKIVSD